jgi:hypothetical protein
MAVAVLEGSEQPGPEAAQACGSSTCEGWRLKRKTRLGGGSLAQISTMPELIA